MTKEEINSRIQSNRNQAAAQRSRVSFLDGEIASLNGQINDLRAQIAQLEAERADLNRKIEELYQLKSKYQTLQNNFANRQAQRRSKLNANFSGIKNFKFIVSYFIGMGQLLSGSEYGRAHDGLTTAQETIARKIRELQDQVDRITADIGWKQSSIETKTAEVMSDQRAKDTANRNLASCNRQIEILQGQLPYALA